MKHVCPEGWVLHDEATGVKECATCGETEYPDAGRGYTGLVARSAPPERGENHE